MKVTADYNGVSYTFDPRAQAMKDLGVTEETAERTALAKKTLEYMKVARQRAKTGAVLRYVLNQIEKGEKICAEAIFSACRVY